MSGHSGGFGDSGGGGWSSRAQSSRGWGSMGSSGFSGGRFGGGGADGAAADFEVVVEVGASARRKYHMFWRIGYVSPDSESQT